MKRSLARKAKLAPMIKRQSKIMEIIFWKFISPLMSVRDPVSVIEITVAREKSIVQKKTTSIEVR